MFAGTTVFNTDISSWEVGSVTDMGFMFYFAFAFNEEICSWDVSIVTNMTSMFRDATAFNQDLSGWCVSLITNKPSNFDTGATSWVLARPVWGTCPNPDFYLAANGVTVICTAADVGDTGAIGGVTYTKRSRA